MNSNESLLFIFELVKALVSVETVVLIVLIATFIPGTWLNRAANSIVHIKLPWLEAYLKFPDVHERESKESSIVSGKAQVVGAAEVIAEGTAEKKSQDAIELGESEKVQIDKERYPPLKPAGATILSTYVTSDTESILRQLSVSSNTLNIREWAKIMRSFLSNTEISAVLMILFTTAFIDLDYNLKLQITKRGKAYLEWLDGQS